MKITIIPTRSDNYSYLLQSSDGKVAIIDAGESEAIINILEAQNLTLDYIFCTHHHYDHIDGIPNLQEKYRAKLYAAEQDSHRIPNIDKGLKDSDTITFGDEKIRIIDTPGHTIGHICYYAEKSHALFCADTLFSLGCGRLFEGTPEQMHSSLQKLADLPDETNIYPGHEYTQSNGEFCLHVDQKNTALQKRMEEVRTLRTQNKPTVPVTLATEKATNPFLNAKTARQFAELRSQKDNF